MEKNYYIRADVERILSVSASTVKRLLNVGILDGWKEPGQSGTGKVWCISIESVQKYAQENNINLVDRTAIDNRQSTIAHTVDHRSQNNYIDETKEVNNMVDSRPDKNSVDCRQSTIAQSTVDRELQAEMAILKKELELTKNQLTSATEDYRKDKDFLHQQLEVKDTMINQQNSIIMATQKNMNDLLQQHNELKYTSTKKEDLIKQLEYDRKKTESSVKAIVKLERTIEDALLTKRLKDGIEFSKQLLKQKKR